MALKMLETVMENKYNSKLLFPSERSSNNLANLVDVSRRTLLLAIPYIRRLISIILNLPRYT